MPWSPAAVALSVIAAADPGKVATVAGDCRLKRVDGTGLSKSRFKKLLRAGRPFLVHSLDVSKIQSSGEELENFGSSKVQLEAGIDEASASFRLTKEWRSFREYSQHPTGEQELVFEHGFIGNLSRFLWGTKFLLLPKTLQHALAFPILTIGTNGTGTSMHQHEGTWLLLIQGLKVWWLADRRVPSKSIARRDPCQFLGAEGVPEGFHVCHQKAGELLYFPDDWHHATCNVEPFVWGLGSQGSNSHWPPLVLSASLGDAVNVQTALRRADGLSRAAFAAALQRSVGLGHWDVADVLMKFAADFRGADAGEAVGYCPAAPIHAVAEHGHAALAAQLLTAGFDPEEPLSSSVSFIALEISAYLGHANMVALLLQQPGPLLQSQRSTILANSLRNAAQNGHLPVMRLLLDQGASPLLPDGEGRTALHMAAAGGQVAALRFLKSTGQSGDLRDHQGHTPLHAASERGHAKVARQLIKWKGSLRAENSQKRQPLHLAARQGHVPVLRLLLEMRADVEVEDEAKARPVHFAVISGCLRTVEFLVRTARAQVDVRNKDGELPLHLAVRDEHASIIRLLVESRADLTVASTQQHSEEFAEL